MRKRRNNGGKLAAAVRPVASLCRLLGARIRRRPIDSFALFAAALGSGVIVVNALALQTGSRPVPFAVTPAPAVAPAPSRSAEAPTRGSTEVARTTRNLAPPRSDPIAQLIDTTSRVIAVQRALSDFGYGQITRSGVLDPPTVVAIERFERDHKLPVTGRITDRLLSDLAALAGHPLD